MRQVREFRRPSWIKNVFKRSIPLSNRIVSPGPTPLMAFETEEKQRLLERLLAELSEPMRARFVLFEIQGYTSDEGAALHRYRSIPLARGSGLHIPLWLDAENPAIGWGVSPSFPYQEGTFFGNIIDTGPLTDTGKPSVTGPAAYYCDGDGFTGGSSGEVAGRLGSNQVNSPYSNPFGNGVLCKNSAGAVGEWSAGMYDTKGNLKNPDGYKALNTKNATWSNAITVWRNPSYTPVFDAGYRYTIQPLSTHANPMVLDAATSQVLPQPMSSLKTSEKLIFTANGANWSISLNNSPTKCLDAGTGDTMTPITIQTCKSSSTSQQWTITPYGNSYGTFMLKNGKGTYLTDSSSLGLFAVETYGGYTAQFFAIQAVAVVD